MSTKLTNLRTGIAAALATINGAGAYTIDLSGTDQVVQGAYSTPTRNGVPVVMLAAWSLSSRHGEALGRYTRTVEWSLLCWAPATIDAPAQRMLAMEDMLNDVTVALETAIRGPAPTITDWNDVQLLEVAEAAELDGDAAGCVTFVARYEFVCRANKTGGV